LSFLLLFGYAFSAALKMVLAIEESLCLEPIFLIASDGTSLLFPELICEVANAVNRIQHADSAPSQAK